MLTKVVFRDPPELPHSLCDPQPRLRGWQWMAIGMAFGLAAGTLLGLATAPRMSPETERLNRLVHQAHLKNIEGSNNGM